MESAGHQDAVDAIKDFLKSFAALPVDKMERSSFEEELRNLKSKLQDQAASNSVLNDILVEGMAATS